MTQQDPHLVDVNYFGSISNTIFVTALLDLLGVLRN